MSGSKLPFFRWYPADAESDELYASMTDTELGFFHRLLNKSWINNGLPSNTRDLCLSMKVSLKYLERVWPRVSKAWFEKDGRLYNRRQEEERTHAITKSERATDAVRTRYVRRADDLPRAVARDSESDSESETTATTENHQQKTIRESRGAYGSDVCFDAERWAKTDSTITHFHPDTDTAMRQRIISTCIQAYISSGGSGEIDDDDIAYVLEKTHTSKQYNSALWVKTAASAVSALVRESSRKTGSNNGKS